MPRRTRILALLFVVLAGCERVDESQARREPVVPATVPAQPLAPLPAPPPAPATSPAPAVGISAPRPLATVRPQPARRSARKLTEAELPKPPSVEPAAYERWYAALEPGVRAQLDAFCRRDGLSYHVECGGIGPYHIPRPPSLVVSGGMEEYDRWLASLTARQHRYFVHWCKESTDEDVLYSTLCGGTPLVVQLDPATPIELAAPGIDGVNAARTPWLVFDRNGDGAITIDELFGDATPLADGTYATNGFAALAQYDANGDGVIDARDPIFARLALWDRTTLTPLASQVARIELANHREPRCNRFGCAGERSLLTTIAGTRGAVVDVYLRR